MLFRNIVDFFKRLFGVKPRETDAEQAENAAFAERYEDISDINITAWVANRIANMVASDSEINVAGENTRAELLNDAVQSCVSKLKNIVTRVLAVGGVVLKPYIYGGRLFTDVLPQNRFINVEQVGDIITGFDGLPITGKTDLTAQVRALAAGSSATLTYVRDGEAATVDVTLGTLQ